MAQYESYPTGGEQGGWGGQPAPKVRPKSVQTAVTLIWVSIALGVVAALVSFTSIDAQLEAAGVDPDTPGASAGAVIGGVIGLVISVAIPVLLAVFIGKGANWARIVYTVLAALGLLFGVFGLIGAAALGAIQLVLQVVSLALTIAILVFLYRSDSNRYFAAR